MPHDCQQETKIASMESTLADIKAIVLRIDVAINGNGKAGLKERQALTESGLSRVWWTIGGMGAGFLTILGIMVVVLVK